MGRGSPCTRPRWATGGTRRRRRRGSRPRSTTRLSRHSGNRPARSARAARSPSWPCSARRSPTRSSWSPACSGRARTPTGRTSSSTCRPHGGSPPRSRTYSMLTLADVEAAAAAIAGAVVRTPSSVSQTLSDVLGCTVVVKFENLQFVASFKERGARNKLLSLTDAERAAGVVAVSAGNHAQAVARHARLLGIDATIVMPKTTPYVKVGRTKALGARVELWGESVAEAMAFGHELVAREGRTFVHPFDDERVIAGQGTVGLEVFADHPKLDALVVPVGGGGLLGGISVVAKAKAPNVELIGVQTEAYPSM